jgi:CBS domain-containing protein
MLLAIEFDNLHQILRSLYTDMMPLCGNMAGVAKGIAGLGALFYVAAKVWQSLASAEPIDVYPLLRPFVIGFCIMFFPTFVLGTINSVMSPVVKGCNNMLETQTFDMNAYREQKDKLEYEAMVRNPEILLMDEAFSALDPLIRVQMQDEMLALQSKMKKTIVFITHDLSEAIKLGDRIAIMRDGEVVQVGTSEEILTEPANDYVARFVENVDRSKIITAGSIMITRPAVARLRKEGPEVLIRKMKERDITVLPVIDENDKLIGEITLESAAILRRKGIKSIQEAVQSEVHSVTEDTKIEDLLPLITKTNSPIYVVNEERELKGLVPLSSIVVEMTGKDKEEINELIQNAIEL